MKSKVVRIGFALAFHIEGSRLSHDQTRYIFETNMVGVEDEVLHVDDIIETVNHFRCMDMIFGVLLKIFLQ